MKKGVRHANKEHVNRSLQAVGVTPKQGKTAYNTEKGGGHHREQSGLHYHEIIPHMTSKGFKHTGTEQTPGVRVGTSPGGGGGRHVSGERTEHFSHPSGVTAAHTSGFGRPSIAYHVPPAKS